MEALTVRPTLRAKYSDEAPKMMPKSEPTITERAVNSRSAVFDGIYGVNGALGWAMSGSY
jgi:hypothetical protein